MNLHMSLYRIRVYVHICTFIHLSPIFDVILPKGNDYRIFYYHLLTQGSLSDTELLLEKNSNPK